MTQINNFFFSEIEFCHESFSIYHFPYINNKIEENDRNNHTISIYGLEENYNVFYKIYNEISYCNKKNVKISCNAYNSRENKFIAYESCYANSFLMHFAGMNIILKFVVRNPKYYLAGVPVGALTG
jgi:hypothetical protein